MWEQQCGQGRSRDTWNPHGHQGRPSSWKQSAGTTRWGHGVKKPPNPRINNLWKCASNFFAHKNQNKPYGKAFPIPPSRLVWLLSAVCLKAKVCWCLWFSSHRVSSFSLCLGLCPEKVSVTGSRSWFSPFQFIWLLGGSISEPISELFSSCLSFSSHLCWFNSDSAFSNRLKIQIDSNYLKVIYP